MSGEPLFSLGRTRALRIFQTRKSARAIPLGHGQLQGPTRRVKLNTTVRQPLTNALFTDGTSLHHHGIHQVGTPYFDGAVAASWRFQNDTATHRSNRGRENSHDADDDDDASARALSPSLSLSRLARAA